jgi:hypothetical protein
VNSKEANSETPDNVQECGLLIHTHSPKTKCFFAGDISGPGFKEVLYTVQAAQLDLRLSCGSVHGSYL